MSRAQYDRKDPQDMAYYQSLADVFAVYWQFHKARLTAGELPFAGFIIRNDIEPFDPMRDHLHHLTRAFKHTPVSRYDAIKRYILSVIEVTDYSWRHFLSENRMLGIIGRHNIDPTLAPESHAFIDPYVATLLSRAQKNIERSIRFGSYEDLIEVGSVGQHTGIDTTVHLAKLFGREFQPLMPVILSKVRLWDTRDMRRHIGIVNVSDPEGIQPDYALLDDSRLGISTEGLKAFGLGSTIGCPAGMMPSHETRDFLHSRGVDSMEPMLTGFARSLYVDFDHRILSWYERLSEKDRGKYFEEKSIRDLSGETRREALASRCPFSHKSKER